MEQIKTIIEAFSMQPCSKTVTLPEKRSEYYPENDIKEIRLEEMVIGNNPSTAEVQMMYVGYDYNDKKVFQYLAKSVNVDFF